MKAVFLDFATMGPNLDVASLRGLLPDLEVFDNTNDDEIAGRIDGAEFVFANKFRFTPEILENAGSLRFIGLAATGVDNVDLDGAKEHGVAVANIRAYCTQSTVEHVFGTLLMLTHSLHRYNGSVRAGDWQRSEEFCMLTHPVRELSAMKLGIVGHGVLGSAVARTGEWFGMDVLVSQRPGFETTESTRIPFDQVLEQADVLSLHCPLTEQTRGLIGEKELKRMKTGAYLINTARGGLIDANALVAALENGEIAGAAVDVLEKEPPVDGNPLLDYKGDNLIVTPHIAWATNEARQNALEEMAANVKAFLAGEERNRIV